MIPTSELRKCIANRKRSCYHLIYGIPIGMVLILMVWTLSWWIPIPRGVIVTIIVLEALVFAIDAVNVFALTLRIQGIEVGENEEKMGPASSHAAFPLMFYCGVFTGCAVVVAAVWLFSEDSPWTLSGVGRLIGASVFGSLLLTGVLGTALESISRKSVSGIRRAARSSSGLFVVGALLVFLSLPLIAAMLSILAYVLDSCQVASLRTKLIVFSVAGLASIVLSTAIVVRAIVQVAWWLQKGKHHIET